MKTRDLVFMSLLMGIGFVLHAVIPGFFFGMKPDMFLVMMFIGILFYPSFKNVLLLGIIAGILSAMTTNFPAGQIPNIIDKGLTAIIFFLMVLFVKNHKDKMITLILLTFVGTLISGSIFLGSALIISQLPVSFMTLFITVVLPTAGVNSIALYVFYSVLVKVQKRTT